MFAPVNQIKETCLYVKDLARTKAFYEGTLGLELINFTPGRHAFFRAGSSVLLCFDPEATRAETQLPPHFATGLQHLAFEVPVERYAQTRQSVLDRGIRITAEQEWHGGLWSFYFDDPDGHVLEVVPAGLWG